MSQNITSSTIGKATAWSFAAELAAKLLVPITNIILARILVPEVFGIIATINMVISFAETISAAGFNKYIVQHNFATKEELYKSSNVAFWTNFSISCLAWLLIFFFRGKISSYVGNPGYGIPLVVASLAIPLTALSSIHESLFQRALNYKILFIRRLAVSLLPFVVTVPLALLGLSFWSLIIGSLASCILKIVLLSINSEWKPVFYYRFPLLKKMFSFSAWTLFESIAMWASTYIDILIISNSLGAYYTGLYKNSQYIVTSILTIITGATTSVLFASLSRFQDDKSQFESVFYSFQKNTAVFVIPLGLGIYCYSDVITYLLLGPRWEEASVFVGIWGLCTSLVAVFGTYCREVYRAKGEPKVSLVAQIFHLLFVVPICLVFVKRGFVELSYARSFAYLQIIFVHFVIVQWRYNISVRKMFFIIKEPLFCALLMLVLSYSLKLVLGTGYFLQIIEATICIIAYFALLLLFPGYREDYHKCIYKLMGIIHLKYDRQKFRE